MDANVSLALAGAQEGCNDAAADDAVGEAGNAVASVPASSHGLGVPTANGDAPTVNGTAADLDGCVAAEDGPENGQ